MKALNIVEFGEYLKYVLTEVERQNILIFFEDYGPARNLIRPLTLL